MRKLSSKSYWGCFYGTLPPNYFPVVAQLKRSTRPRDLLIPASSDGASADACGPFPLDFHPAIGEHGRRIVAGGTAPIGAADSC